MRAVHRKDISAAEIFSSMPSAIACFTRACETPSAAKAFGVARWMFRGIWSRRTHLATIPSGASHSGPVRRAPAAASARSLNARHSSSKASPPAYQRSFCASRYAIWFSS